MKNVFLLELNELNFEYIEKYIELGKLKNFAGLIGRHGIVQTVSESEYDHLEPWIQWVTAHTGRTFAEHQVFRLGDITKVGITQIWEFLEKHGLKVGAVSPMNASNKLVDPSFFVPDPWTETSPAGSMVLRKMSEAVSQAVGDNAKSKVKFESLLWLLAGVVRYARVVNYLHYIALILQAFRKKSWAKAQFLDLLLTDLFVCECKSKKPQFASLFLNAGAHIQHHYLFNSAVYEGDQKNPEWLLSASSDPILDVYQQYDRSIGQIIKAFPDARLLIATGLHQDPYPGEKYYWRLKNHEEFLEQIDLSFKSVEPLMSRDFMIECHSAEEASVAQLKFESIRADDGVKIFEVDNRGESLFVMLTYPSDVTSDTKLTVGTHVMEDFRDNVVFVALKNGEHNGIGYSIDTGMNQRETGVVQLSELPAKIASLFGLCWGEGSTQPSETETLGTETNYQRTESGF